MNSVNELYKDKVEEKVPAKGIYKPALIFLFLLGIQVICGAFVAGSKESFGYNSFLKKSDGWG